MKSGFGIGLGAFLENPDLPIGGKGLPPYEGQGTKVAAAPVRVASAAPTAATEAVPGSSGTGTGGTGGGGTSVAVTSAPPVQSQHPTATAPSSSAPVVNRDDTRRSRGIMLDAHVSSAPVATSSAPPSNYERLQGMAKNPPPAWRPSPGRVRTRLHTRRILARHDPPTGRRTCPCWPAKATPSPPMW